MDRWQKEFQKTNPKLHWQVNDLLFWPVAFFEIILALLMDTAERIEDARKLSKGDPPVRD